MRPFEQDNAPVSKQAEHVHTFSRRIPQDAPENDAAFFLDS
jgi:hypothetical protein